MDCSIVPLKKIKDTFVISTIDFFYPLVEDPYVQGKIGCANVLSDMYSMGIDEVDNMLMVLGASKNMKEEDRYISTREMMRGFNDHANAGGTEVTGGQSVINPWPIIGGVAMAVCHKDDFIPPYGLEAGDVIVLTKPLGTQVAVNLKEWLSDPTGHLYTRVKDHMSPGDINKAYDIASQSMEHLSRVGARLMRKHGSHGATDVTGFGVLGHANNLAVAQKAEVGIIIHTLPVIAKTAHADSSMGNMFKLLEGYSAETSGGLFAAFPTKDAAIAYIADLQNEDGTQAWIVGDVVPRTDSDSEVNYAKVASDANVINVDKFFSNEDA